MRRERLPHGARIERSGAHLGPADRHDGNSVAVALSKRGVGVDVDLT